MPGEVTQFFSPYLNGTVELTAEREQHITQNHPDLLPKHRDGFRETLLDPDEIRSSLQLSSALRISSGSSKVSLKPSRCFRETLLDPDEIRSSLQLSSALLFSK